MALKEKSNQQQENKKAFRSCNTDSSSSANSQLKFQSRPADSYNLTDNSAIGKPSGEISYASNSASNVVTEETFHLMDDLNLQGLNDISVLWEAPVDDPTIAETGAIYTGKEVEISKSDSKKSEQLKVGNLCTRVRTYVCVLCLCACACMHACVCVVCMFSYIIMCYLLSTL